MLIDGKERRVRLPMLPMLLVLFPQSSLDHFHIHREPSRLVNPSVVQHSRVELVLYGAIHDILFYAQFFMRHRCVGNPGIWRASVTSPVEFRSFIVEPNERGCSP